MGDLIRFTRPTPVSPPRRPSQPPLQPAVDATDMVKVPSQNWLTLSPVGRASTRLSVGQTPPGNALPGLSMATSQAPSLPAWSRPTTGIPPGNTTAATSNQRLSGLPSRPAGSDSGSQFIARTAGLSRPQRERAILQEISHGNVPDFNRQYKPVQTTFTDANGQRHTGTFYVLPDYLAIGHDRDFVRMPMSPLTAQQIADKTGAVLPTRKMVDAIYGQARVRLAPSPQPAGPQMMSNDYVIRHQRTIEGQRAGQPPGALTAGHKKDVVVSNRLVQKPQQVAIYGWHQPDGKAIQGLSTVHENSYADYSHGIRLVAPYMAVDGRRMKTADVMRSETLSGLVSDEGPLRLTRIPGT